MNDEEPRRCRDCGRRMTRLAKQATGLPRHRGLNLCDADYSRRARRGTLPESRRPWRRSEHVIEEWQALARDGISRERAADILGMSRNTLDKAISRWKQRNQEV